MYCHRCGHEIDENVSFCPYCGQKQEKSTPKYQYSSATQNSSHEFRDMADDAGRKLALYNSMCLIGFGLSVLSLFTNNIAGIVGLIVSIIGLRQQRGTNQKGKILAIVGIIIGGVQAAMTVFVLVMFALNMTAITGWAGNLLHLIECM